MKSSSLVFSLFSSLFILFFLSSSTFADSNKNQQGKRWYVLTWENDIIAQSDDGYTNGVAFAWGYGPYDGVANIRTPGWIKSFNRWLGLYKNKDNKFASGYAISQGMYTPDYIESPDLVEDDRPYAGTLIWKARTKSYGANSASSRALILGVIGPAAKAGETQKLIHKITDGTEPMGWDHQIKNEPVFRIDAEHIDRFWFTESGSNRIGADLIWYSTGGAGNLLSDIGTGLTFRTGNSLDRNYAFVNPDPARGINVLAGTPGQGLDWQVLLSVYGRYVFNDITLQGNTFKESHSVDLIHEQALVSLSAAATWNSWGLVLSIVSGTDTFEQQLSDTQYGAVSLTYHH